MWMKTQSFRKYLSSLDLCTRMLSKKNPMPCMHTCTVHYDSIRKIDLIKKLINRRHEGLTSVGTNKDKIKQRGRRDYQK